MDRDFNYSEAPATIRVVVHRPYGRLALLSSLGLALVISIGAGGYGWRRRQERDRARTLMAREQRQRIEAQQQALPATVPTELNWTVDDFVEQSPAMQTCLNQVRALQQESNAHALIVGEPGTGKELIARALHAGSPHQQGAFVPLRCAGLPQDLQALDTRTQVQSQLFGHAQGAFAGAEDERQGLVQEADGGTLFFDEVGLLPLPLQYHLLRVLKQGQVRRLGEETARVVAVRVLAASQMDLELQVQLGLFRQEFYQFIAPIKLEVPPLRQRVEDIGPLARLLVLELAKEIGKEGVELSTAAMEQLATYRFPGNVRQLRSILERALLATTGQPISPEHLPAE